MNRLADKIAIVTGAASGFGRGIAEAYAREGAKVVIADLNGAGARAVADAIGAAAVSIAADVTRRADVEAMVAAAVDNFGGLDILVNNAGATHKNKPALEVTEEEFDRIYAVNVKSLYLTTLAAVPAMEKRGGGVIINTASTAGVRPRPGLTWYNGSKGAAITLTKSLAAELAPKKIRVNAINPVIGETGLLESFMGQPDTPENRARFVATIPLGRMSRPSDIANAAVFLAEDASEFITGVAIEVDGGRCV
ncbi:MAG: glucose 1-dehydrogenase [Alphaproteobacteria bacterium]|nr:glucose 1-dehydrogenase [Alphaproteobacteria bacterium]